MQTFVEKNANYQSFSICQCTFCGSLSAPQSTKVYGKNKINGSNGLNEGNANLKYKNNYVQVV